MINVIVFIINSFFQGLTWGEPAFLLKWRHGYCCEKNYTGVRFFSRCNILHSVYTSRCSSMTLSLLGINVKCCFLVAKWYPGEGNGTPLHYSCLGNPMDGGAWKAAVHGVAKSWARQSDFTFTFHFHALEKEMATHSVFLPGESQGWGSLVGCRLWGRTESDVTEAT